MRLRTAFLVLLAPVALTATAVGLAIAATGPARPVPHVRLHLPIPLTQVEAAPPTHSDPLAVEVDALGTRRYGAVYGGTWPGATGRVHIGVVERGPSADVVDFTAAIRELAADLKERYLVVRVDHSFRSLAALTLRVRETAAMKTAGILLVQWGPDPASNRVVVRVRGSERVVERSLRRRFGPGWFAVRPWKGSLPVAGPAVSPVTAPKG